MSWFAVVGLAGAGCLSFVLLAGSRPAAQPQIVPGAVVSQPFGCTPFELEPSDASCPSGHVHYGIDLAAPEGTPVLAPEAGIAYSGAGPACGIHVLIDHGGGVETVFCHLSEAVAMTGRPVAAGERIGRVGATGFATGPHLHFEVHAAGRPVDPAAWLRSLPAPINPSGGK